ncbi:hypothetical protein MKX01_008827 [Papaver californicum]|nr:hypothetical protein MKX01_008827 [Papaver californicum]
MTRTFRFAIAVWVRPYTCSFVFQISSLLSGVALVSLRVCLVGANFRVFCTNQLSHELFIFPLQFGLDHTYNWHNQVAKRFLYTRRYQTSWLTLWHYHGGFQLRLQNS